MVKTKRYKRKYTMGTAFFLILLLVAVIGALPTVSDYYQTYVWLILGIAGAIVAILNIQVREEVSFLIATTSLLVIIIAFLAVPSLSGIGLVIKPFLTNLAVGFGVAGFVVAVGLIAKLGLEK